MAIELSGEPMLSHIIKLVRTRADDAVPVICMMRFERDPQHTGPDLVGELSAANKITAFRKARYHVRYIPLKFDTHFGAFSDLVCALETDLSVAAVLLQNPVPRHIFSRLPEITLSKELDGHAFHGRRYRWSATAEAAMILIKKYSTGDNICVVGARGYIGLAITAAAQETGRTVHSIEQGEPLYIKKDDCAVVSAVGYPGLLNAGHLHNHQILIDCGQSVIDLNSFTIVGDMDRSCKTKAAYITPVPGGMGPLSISVLLKRANELMGHSLPVAFDSLLTRGSS